MTIEPSRTAITDTDIFVLCFLMFFVKIVDFDKEVCDSSKLCDCVVCCVDDEEEPDVVVSADVTVREVVVAVLGVGMVDMTYMSYEYSGGSSVLVIVVDCLLLAGVVTKDSPNLYMKVERKKYNT